MLRVGVIVISAALAGCQNTTAERSGVPVMHRTDGRSASSNSELALKAKQDMAVCAGEANKASLGAAPAFYSTNLAENLMADQFVGQQRKKVVSVYVGCMAERGYLPGDKPAAVMP